MRSELTDVQRAEHLAKRKELWEQRLTGGTDGPTCLEGRASAPTQYVEAFAADAARKVGMSKRSINRDIARANAIPEDVRDDIRGTHLDKGVYLDEIMLNRSLGFVGDNVMYPGIPPQLFG